MGKIICITGGTRSGKSRFAERYVDQHDDVIYVATALAIDEEMKHRIEKHRSRRNPEWITVEAYRDFDEVLEEIKAGRGYILLDCITVMITNLMLEDKKIDWDIADNDIVERISDKIHEQVARFLGFADRFPGTTVIVTNELGMGMVPVSPMGRHFRDIAGSVNQRIAAAADEVFLLVAGLPLQIK